MPAKFEGTLDPKIAKQFVSADDPKWPLLVERYKRENIHSRGHGPPMSCKAGSGWYFPPDWLEAYTPKWQRG